MKSVKSDSSENTGWYSPVRKHVKVGPFSCTAKNYTLPILKLRQIRGRR